MFDDLYRRKERKEMEIVLYDVCICLFTGKRMRRERGREREGERGD